jgi:ribosomal protein S18 acetylase RimI-like enzyme
MDIDYRKVVKEDYYYVVDLIQRNLDYVIQKSFNGKMNYSVYFRRMRKSGLSNIILYNKVECGILWCTIRGQSLHVNTIVIDKEYQGKGIGSKIFYDIEKLAEKYNLTSIDLGVQGVNVRAKNFYKKLGFKEYGYNEEFDTIYMQKKLKYM